MEQRYAILNEKDELVPCEVEEWCVWFESNPGRRVVKRTEAMGTQVSTVFLGINHGWGERKDLWYETCVFYNQKTGIKLSSGRELSESEVVARYETRAEAIAGHEKWVKVVFQPRELEANDA